MCPVGEDISLVDGPLVGNFAHISTEAKICKNCFFDIGGASCAFISKFVNDVF